MDLDPRVCYRAVASRDRRFEGRFVVAVTTTGVYCRPGCPARLPQPRHARFFSCPASAEDAGFRPCLRCRPEAAPGSPGWVGTSATVSRALRLIHDGALDDGSVEALAERLGVGSRHLRRLFDTHLGTSPLSVARTRRAHFAKRLLDDTDLSIGRVALAAGYESLRSFNQSIRETFHRTPTELRRLGGGGTHRDGPLRLRLPYRRPFDWRGLLAFLGPRAVPGVEAVDGDTYRRAVNVDGRVGVIEVAPVPGDRALRLSVSSALVDRLLAVVQRVSRLFDLEADPDAIAQQLRRDLLLRPLVAHHPGRRVPGAWDGFELAVRAVLGQQVSVSAATTFAGRLVRLAGTPLPEPDPRGLTHVFPDAAAVADADVARLGLTRARARTLVALAAATRDGRLSFDARRPVDGLASQLGAIPGIGEWTVQYVAMRALHEPDAFPATDLGLRRAVAARGAPATPRALLRRAEAWRPWRAYGVMHLWMSEVES
jgi:AraC family transcriptional regulator of adaptative response / DNA-3-methyladenine glycosylase II